MGYDTIIRNGRWFDGTGAPSAVRSLGIRDGHVVSITPGELDETDCPQVIDAGGKKRGGDFTRLRRQQLRVLPDRDRMQIDDTENTLVIVLQAHEIAYRAEVIAEMKIAGRLHTGKNTAH